MKNPSIFRDERQRLVYQWVVAAFGYENAQPTQRAVRFLEEAVELAQVCQVPKDMALRLIEYVYSQPTGTPRQELGGVGLTLLALAESLNMSADDTEILEFNRVRQKPLSHYAARNANKDALGFKVPPRNPHTSNASDIGFEPKPDDY